MAATKQEIEGWFDRGVEHGHSYMLVICDTFDHEDYPAYAKTERDCLSHYNDPGAMQRVMEVYDLRAEKAEQMNERRAMRLPVMPNAEFRPTHAASSREVAPGTEG